MNKEMLPYIFKNNPILTSMLGIVPIMGATVFGLNALVMGLATGFVLFFSNLLVFYIKEYVNKSTELFIYFISTSVFTTIVFIFLKLFYFEMYNKLNLYIPLIMINCFLLKTLSFSSSEEKLRSVITMLLRSFVCFVVTITFVGIVRELLGNGSFFGYRVVPEEFPRMLIFNTSAGGFILLGVLSMFFNTPDKDVSK